jgi:hypothetical protein
MANAWTCKNTSTQTLATKELTVASWEPTIFHHGIFGKKQHDCHPPPILLTWPGPLQPFCLSLTEGTAILTQLRERGRITDSTKHPHRTPLLWDIKIIDISNTTKLLITAKKFSNAVMKEEFLKVLSLKEWARSEDIYIFTIPLRSKVTTTQGRHSRMGLLLCAIKTIPYTISAFYHHKIHQELSCITSPNFKPYYEDCY